MRSRNYKLKTPVKILKGTEAENLSNPKFIAPKAIRNPKLYESELNWN